MPRRTKLSIKKQLASDPILKTIDPSKDFVIQADGSSTGIGYAILQQSGDGTLHPVSYGARALTGAQSRYTPAKTELMSVALALKEIETIAIHKNITVLTNNSSVLHFQTGKCSPKSHDCLLNPV